MSIESNQAPVSAINGKPSSQTEAHTLSNGLQLLCLPLDHTEYISLNLVMPSGVINDPAGEMGSSLLLAELLGRGAGELDGRQLLTEFDAGGIRHGESSSLLHTSLRSSFLPDQVEKAMDLLSQMILEPHFPEDALEPVKSLFLHDIRSIKENPSRWAMMELATRYFSDPFNRSSLGTEEGILAAKRDSLVEQWEKRLGPKKAVLSIAGNFSSAELIKLAEDKLGKWNGESEGIPALGDFPAKSKYFIDLPGSQQQLVLRAPSAVMGSDDYYVAKVFSQILSGGMFGRLFIEVREKRGLCYSVYGQHSARKEYGSFTVYAGTTPERVHETYEVIHEIMKDPMKDLSDGELTRAKNNLLSQIVISEESTGSRSRSNASDWLTLGRIRPLEEITDAVMKVSIDDLNEFVSHYPFSDPASLTLGAKNFGDWKEDKARLAKID